MAINHPISREDAVNRNLGVPLPLSAAEILYSLKSGGLQQMDFYLRFYVDPLESESAIQAMVDDNNKKMGRELVYRVENVRKVKKLPSEVQNNASLGVPEWWAVDQIINGYVRAEAASYAPVIWYDRDRSLIFLRLID